MAKINWDEEKEKFRKYASEHVHLLNSETFNLIYDRLKEGLGGIDTVALTVMKKDGTKDYLFNVEELQRTAGDFTGALFGYLLTHELSEDYFVNKRGFNLRKDMEEKWKQRGEAGRPAAHLLALRQEYLAAWENGDLDELHNWWRQWMNERIKEKEARGEGEVAKKQRENMDYREETYKWVNKRTGGRR